MVLTKSILEHQVQAVEPFSTLGLASSDFLLVVLEVDATAPFVVVVLELVFLVLLGLVFVELLGLVFVVLLELVVELVELDFVELDFLLEFFVHRCMLEVV